MQAADPEARGGARGFLFCCICHCVFRGKGWLHWVEDLLHWGPRGKLQVILGGAVTGLTGEFAREDHPSFEKSPYSYNSVGCCVANRVAWP